jgi:hypothetical protein
MKTGILSLCALSGLTLSGLGPFLSAAEPSASLAIYYSFDSPPPASSFGAMQSELDRILAPTQLRVVWRAIGKGTPSETYPDLVVLHFRGACLFDPSAVEPVFAGETLAETELSDGRILPFGEVECDPLRRFVAPLAGPLKIDRANKALGRAMARVTAHEIYHMLTRSMRHASSGIARASHSRADLLSASFGFAKPEQEWLRQWSKHLVPQEVPASSNGVVTLVHDTP